jgi:hypothetical protein
MEAVHSNNVLPMTFAGGPTYMPEYLKAALKEKIFGGTHYCIETIRI